MTTPIIWGQLCRGRRLQGVRVDRSWFIERSSLEAFTGRTWLLVQVPTGTALVHNANWGLTRIRVRPPYSKVRELGETEVRQLVGRHKDPSETATTEAQ